MRQKLEDLGGDDRHRFCATVERYGSKPAYRGYPTPTILLRNVTFGEEIVTDHLWFVAGKWTAGLRPGDRIEFNARVACYRKGYQGRKAEELGENNEEWDWKLSHPTKVKKVHDGLNAVKG